MMRIVYQNIVANMPDGKTVQHNWWPNGEMGDQSESNISRRVRDRQSSTTGLGPKFTMLVMQVKSQCTCPPKWGALTDELTLLRTPLSLIGLGLQLLWLGC